MENLETYKQNIKRMFFISVKKDLDKWSKDYYGYRIKFTSKEGYVFELILSGDYLLLSDIKISHFRISLPDPIKIPSDIKVWWYYRKIKKHFKNVENNKKNQNDIDFLKKGLSTIEENYLKEIRRKKLIQLKNN